MNVALSGSGGFHGVGQAEDADDRLQARVGGRRDQHADGDLVGRVPALPGVDHLGRGRRREAQPQHVSWRAGTVRSVSSVTMPQRHPPAPRSAQNRSGSRSASQRTTCPSASTTWALSSWSQVESIAAPEQADAATQREAGDADGRPAAARQCAPVRGERVVELAQPHPGAHGHAAVAHGDRAHRRQVDQQAARRGATLEAVAAGPDGDRHPFPPGERRGHLLRRGAAGDDPRAHVLEALENHHSLPGVTSPDS